MFRSVSAGLRYFSSSARNAPLGRSSTSSANMLNRQRVRKAATYSGLWPADSRERATAARWPATSRVTAAEARVGSSSVGSSQTRRRRSRTSGSRQVGELDPVGAGVGERRVGAAGARELGVELDHVPDVDDHQEGRAALGGREGPGVVLGLSAGAQQRVVEALGLGPLTDLLRLEDECAAPVAVDEARACAAVAVGEGHPALEDVGVVARVLARRIGGGHVEECAELPDEELVVRALRA
jgi:hypothetical protein